MKRKELRPLADKFAAASPEQRDWIRSQLSAKDRKQIDSELRLRGDTTEARREAYRKERLTVERANLRPIAISAVSE